jgi:RNA-binding protein 23/39
MEKLARIDRQSEVSDAANANLSTEQSRPSTIPQAKSRGVHLKNMFNPEEETERGWEVELAEDIKEECQQKYGKVDAIKVDINSMGEVYIRFADVEGAQKAVQGLNGRFFGGRSISAAFISEGFLVSMLS